MQTLTLNIGLLGGRIVLSTCGWLTRTTLSRINAIGVAFAKDFEPWRIRNGELYISNRGNAKNVHTQVYQLKGN